VPASANLQRINNPTGFFDGASEGYDFTGSKFNVTGAAVGGNLWMLGGSADSAFYGTPFVGLSAEHLDSGDWDGQISFVLASVNFDGSAYGTTGGILSFFSEELDAVWSSQDGFLQQSISLTPGAGHEHGFFFFSQPGIYDMTLTASGTHGIEGAVTGTGTFKFEVVPEPSSVMLAGLGLCVTIGLGLRRRLAAARRG
jgi:surface-anchored protein